MPGFDPQTRVTLIGGSLVHTLSTQLRLSQLWYGSRMEETLLTRVRQVISDTGQSDKDFAELIGIDKTKLSKSLKGRRKFSSLELALIAEAGGRTVDWLLSGESSRELHFARRANSPALEEIDEAGSHVVAQVWERFEALERIGLAGDTPTLPKPKNYPLYVDQATSLALEIGGRFPAKISSYETPALIDAVERSLGINVVVADLPSGCDGLSYTDGNFRSIVLGTSDAPFRQRYTLAHEIAHVAFGDAKQTVIQERLWSTRDTVESRANTFAASLLAPMSEVKDYVGDGSAVDKFNQLVLKFQMSPDSMAWRLLNLGLIDANQRQSLSRATARTVAMALGQGAEHAERAFISKSARPAWLLVQQYLDAYWHGETTIRPAAELLGWDEEYAAEFFTNANSDDEMPGLETAE